MKFDKCWVAHLKISEKYLVNSVETSNDNVPFKGFRSFKESVQTIFTFLALCSWPMSDLGGDRLLRAFLFINSWSWRAIIGHVCWFCLETLKGNSSSLQDYLVYWSHRLHHTPLLYKMFHKMHHKYKQPTAWSAPANHPIEFTFNQCLLMSCMFLFPIHWGNFLYLFF